MKELREVEERAAQTNILREAFRWWFCIFQRLLHVCVCVCVWERERESEF
jgi:hypothetical protein